MNYTRYNPRCYSKTKGSSGDDGDGDGDDDDDDDPDEVQREGDDDGDDFPPPGGDFPGRFLPAGELSLSLLFSSPRRWRNIFSIAPPLLRVLEEEVRERAMLEVGQGLLTRPRRGQGRTRAVGWCGPLLVRLGLPFWLPSSSDEIGTSVYFS